jgi:probable F420-dependent oxidoreductase
MKAGILLPQTGEKVKKDDVLYVAKEAEKYGLDSVWVFERLVSALNPQTPYPGTPDGSMPTEYHNVLDPLETLSFVAGNTTTIALGTCIIDMLFHNPVVLAKRFATLDVISNGRAIAGLGIGWSKDEYDISGVPYKQRGERADEYLQVLKSIWTDDVVQFKGRFYNIPASKIGPKPVQKPHPLILLGGFSPNTFRRILKHADGWIPIAGYGSLVQLEQAIKSLREAARKANRDPSSVRIFLLTYPKVHDADISETSRLPMTGSINQIRKDIEQIKMMGANHVIFSHVFSPIVRDVKKMIEVTEQLARFAR